MLAGAELGFREKIRFVWLSMDSKYIFLAFIVTHWTWTIAMSLNTHTHSQFICLQGAVSQHWLKMQASSWWYQINGEIQIRHSRWDGERRPSLTHIKRTLSFPSISHLFLFWSSHWVKPYCPVMLIKNISIKHLFQIAGLKWFECNDLITLT